jgi:hypothetical protein
MASNLTIVNSGKIMIVLWAVTFNRLINISRYVPEPVPEPGNFLDIRFISLSLRVNPGNKIHPITFINMTILLRE